MMAHVTLCVLGPLQISCDGAPVTGLESTKVRALLVYLAVEAGRAHARAALAELLWPDQPEAVAQHNLRQALGNLRQALGDRTADAPLLLITRETVQFNPASTSWLDLAACTALLVMCETHPHRRATTCPSCAERRAHAAALYRGDFLEHFFVGDSAAFEEWASLRRERLRQQVLSALANLTFYAEQRGEYEAAQRSAWRQVELDPWNEQAHQTLMRLLWVSGQRSAALVHYEQFRRMIRHELGVEPSPETITLLARIRDTGLDVAARNEDGRRLPRPSTPLIGRDVELARLADLLQHPTCPLLTLTGPGGVGKTRLALQAANDQRATFVDGVAFVALAPLTTIDLLVPTIASALTLTLAGHDDPTTQLLRYLRNKDLLLVLDNFEHLQMHGAELVSEIVCQAPRVTLLVTSRERLRLSDEQVYPVSPLALPSPQQQAESEQLLDQSPAVALFVARTQAVKPDFQLTPENVLTVVEICRQLDGLPLAIELAAARSTVLQPAALLGRLKRKFPARLTLLTGGARDLHPRQQTLRNTITWSYTLLTLEEQILFTRLGTFAGGWTLEAAEAVCDIGSPGAVTVLDGLQSLVDKSLVQQEEGATGASRFTMLETIREYAVEQLVDRGEAQTLQQHHAAYYLALAEEAVVGLRGREQQVWLDRLEAEHGNLHAVLAWSQAERQSQVFGRLVAALGRFWFLRGHWTEAKHWVERADQSARTLPPTPERDRWWASALYEHTWITRNEGPMQQVVPLAEASLALYRELGDTWHVSRALATLGQVELFYRGDTVGGLARIEEALVRARTVGDPWLLALVLHQFGWCLLGLSGRKSQIARATALLVEGLALAREAGDPWLIGVVLVTLAEWVSAQADYPRATALYGECLALHRTLGNKEGVTSSLLGLARAKGAQGDYAAVCMLNQERLGIERELGNKAGISHALVSLARAAWAQGEYQQAAALYEECLGLARDEGEKDSWALRGLGNVARSQGDMLQAEARLEEALALVRQEDDIRGLANTLADLGKVAQELGECSRAAALLWESLTLRAERGDIPGIIECLEELAGTAGAQGVAMRAARLAGAAVALRTATGAMRPAPECAAHDRAMASAWNQLDDTSWNTAWAEGQAMTVEQAIAYALHDET